MRKDLTSNFLAKVGESFRTPIQLILFKFPAPIGDVWVSDRVMEAAPGTLTIPLVESFGELVTVGQGDDDTTNTRQQTLTLWNGGLTPFSEYFYTENPINVFVEVYQTFDGLSWADVALVDSFVVQEPIRYSEASRLLILDLVSINMRYEAQVGDTVTTDNYSTADPGVVNQGINLIVGTPGEVDTLYVRTPIKCKQKGSILKLATTLVSYDDLDALNFPSDGYLEIDAEVLYYDSRTSISFNITARGQFSTIITEHSDSSIIAERIADHTFLIGQGPLDSVSEVKASGITVDPGDYTLDLASNPATIKFATLPQIPVYSKGARDDEIDFDATLSFPDNNAISANYSYDSDFKGYGALLQYNQTPLGIKQTTEAEDVGEVVRAFLYVEHWASKFYLNDRIDVWVEGIGTVGSLSRPSQEDDFTFDATINLEHDHTHKTGNVHAHGVTANPAFSYDSPTHPHELQNVGQSEERLPSPYSNTISRGYKASYYSTWTFTYGLSAPKTQSGYFDVPIKVTITGGSSAYCDLRFYNRYTGEVTDLGQFNDSRDITLRVNVGAINTSYSGIYQYLRVEVRMYGGAIVGGGVVLTITQPIFYYVTSITSTEETKAIVNGSLTTGTDIATQNKDINGVDIKASTDVNGLPETLTGFENITQANPTRTVVDKFDLTKHLATIDWSWFNDRDVKLHYVGSTNKVDIVVTYVNFQVEYLTRTIEKSSAITCSPVGSIDNRPDMVIQYLLNTVAGLPLANMGSVGVIDPDLWDDGDTWDDEPDIWIDEGEGLDAPPVAAYFERAASRFEFLGYSIDGVIAAELSVRAAVAAVVKQSRSRLTWESGEAKLSVLEKTTGLNFVKELEPEDLQLRSLRVDLGKVSEIANSISLKYKYDNAGALGYQKTAKIEDGPSIVKHGKKAFTDFWDFDLIRDDVMAADVADYYIWKYGFPTSTYEFQTYLPNFVLEKQDAITLTSAQVWDKISQLPLVIKDVSRIFGSGKLKSINLFNVTATNTRTIKLAERPSDLVNIDESITIDAAFNPSFLDSFSMGEEITFYESLGISDTFTPSESFIAQLNFKLALADQFSLTGTVTTRQETNFTDSFTMIDSAVLIELVLGFGVLPFGVDDFGSIIQDLLVFNSSIEFIETVTVELF